MNGKLQFVGELGVRSEELGVAKKTRKMYKICHCEPSRRMVWQSVFLIPTRIAADYMLRCPPRFSDKALQNCAIERGREEPVAFTGREAAITTCRSITYVLKERIATATLRRCLAMTGVFYATVLFILHCALYILHSTLYILHCALCIPLQTPIYRARKLLHFLRV